MLLLNAAYQNGMRGEAKCTINKQVFILSVPKHQRLICFCLSSALTCKNVQVDRDITATAATVRQMLYNTGAQDGWFSLPVPPSVPLTTIV